MWVAQCLRYLRAFIPFQLPLKGFLHLTFTLTPPPLFFCPGVHQSGAMGHWSGEKRSHTLQFLCDLQTDSYLYVVICVFSSVSCFGNRWLIERRVAGTKQVSTVGHLPPDPPPLSFLDSSSALSPWTSYQYRLVLQNQAGNTTGKVVIVDLK